MLAATIARSGDSVAVQRLIARATEGADADAARLALLRGIETGLASAGGRGGRAGGAAGGRGRAGTVAPRAIALASEPAALTRLAAADSDAGRIAKSIAGKIDWPGKPAPAVDVAPLTDEQQRRFSAGAELYKNICMGCHQVDGRGREKLAPDLVESHYVTSPDAGAATRILLGGKEGQIGLMPPLGSALDDEQVASVLTYIRREWGHTAAAVAPDEVREIRGLTKTRTRPWTDAELQQVRGRTGGH
jgi:mono/diheme cytochrome c family protein